MSQRTVRRSFQEDRSVQDLKIAKRTSFLIQELLLGYSKLPGPLGPVWKILVVRSGPEGPQFARSVGTLELFNH